jgi:hypothetical protein
MSSKNSPEFVFPACWLKIRVVQCSVQDIGTGSMRQHNWFGKQPESLLFLFLGSTRQVSEVQASRPLLAAQHNSANITSSTNNNKSPNPKTHSQVNSPLPQSKTPRNQQLILQKWRFVVFKTPVQERSGQAKGSVGRDLPLGRQYVLGPKRI